MCTTLRRSGCAFTVDLRIEYQNNSGLSAAAFTTLVNGWETATEDMWNGPLGHQHWRCCSVRFDVATRVGSGTANFHQINVVAGPQTSFVNTLGPGCTGGRWDALDSGNVAAHEAGHLLGLPDEYDYNGPGNSYRNLNPQPAGQPQSIMAQTWDTVAALQSHIDGIMNGLDARCPWWCCIFHWIHRLLDAFRLVFAARRMIPRRFTEVPRMDRPPNDRPIDDIAAMARTGDPSNLMAAAQRLADAGKEQAGIIADALHDDHPLVRWVAVAGADAVGDEETLAAALADGDLRVRLAAAAALARRRDRAGVPVLLDALGSNQVAIGHPPRLAADVAEQALVAIAGERITTDTDSPEARLERWRRWSETTG